MKLLKMVLYNFGSYPILEHDFGGQGLSLIHGATGSGKSTLLDAPTWVLFGLTAKNGTVDGVRSWTADETPTKGILSVLVGTSTVTITRVRGKPSENDLYFQVGDSDPIRGKDMTDTQKVMNEHLGLDPYLYTLGAYYNEFSPTGSFFIDKASKRREMFEQLADLSLPTLLSEKIKDSKLITKKELTVIKTKLSNIEGRLEQVKATISKSVGNIERWDLDHRAKRDLLIVKDAEYENTKAERLSKCIQLQEDFDDRRAFSTAALESDLREIAEILRTNTKECTTCGVQNKEYNYAKTREAGLSVKLDRLKAEVNPHTIAATQIIAETNPHKDQLIYLRGQMNPFLDQSKELLLEQSEIEISLECLKDRDAAKQHTYDSLDQLSILADLLRGELLVQSVKNIETETNRYLESYFDAEIRVQFQVSGGDKLEITIQKSGYECDYRQLSKGQRGLLKLCFSVSVMTAASRKAGVHFDCIMFDEALDGFSSDLKLKAFNLFSELSKQHSSIMVIDHSVELQNLFDQKYLVTIEGDESSIISL